MATTDVWGQFHPSFNAINHILAKGRRLQPANALQWRIDARAFLAQISAQDIRSAAIELLRAVPYPLIAQQAIQAQSSHEEAHNLNDMRKILLIIRDSLRLTRDPTIDHSLDALFDLCKALNLEHRQPTKQEIKRITDDCIVLGSTNHMPQTQAGSNWMHDLITINTENIEDLLDPEKVIDAERYHDLRKRFRSVVHLCIMAGIALGKTHTKLLPQGVALSREFGHQKDMLTASQ